MATYQSAFTGAEIDGAVGTIKTGPADPVPSTTVGAVGQIYRNTTTGQLFRCVKKGIVFTWVDLINITLSETQPSGGLWLEEVV